MAAFTLDTTAARAGSDVAGGISESGEYAGVVTEAKKTKAGTGATGVEFTFKSDAGQEARFLRVWTHDASGTAMAGLNVLNAIMTCMKVREVNEAPGASPQEPAYPELCQRVGFVLRKELYTKNDGSDGYAMQIFMPFDPATRKTAKEVLDDKPAETVDRILSTLKDNDRRKARPAPAAPAASTSGADFDEIPF